MPTKRQPHHRICANPNCRSQFLCYGECRASSRVKERKTNCWCPSYARKKIVEGYFTPKCESRFGKKEAEYLIET